MTQIRFTTESDRSTIHVVEIPRQMDLFAKLTNRPLEELILEACNEYIANSNTATEYKLELLKRKIQEVTSEIKEFDKELKKHGLSLSSVCIAGAEMGGRDYDY